MASPHDVMIICSDLPAGKPLCMHAQTANVCLCICQCPPQNPKYYKSSEPLCLFPNLNSLPVTLSPRYFSVPSYWSIIYLHSKNTGNSYKEMKAMDIAYQLTSKIRWVNTQQVGNNKIIYKLLKGCRPQPQHKCEMPTTT